MNSPLITVLITTYNYGRFIEQAIDSVLSQDFLPEQTQILVIDDGSTDDTSERVKKYGARIEYFCQPNGGQASALNFGFEKARGEIVALLDADDMFLPGKLARIAAAFRQDPALGMVYHCLQEWHMRTDRRPLYHFVSISGDLAAAPDQMFLFVPQPTSAISFRRSSLRPLLPIPERIRMMADCYLVALIPFLTPVLAVSEPLAIYRVHGANAYFSVDGQMPEEARRKRLQLWLIVVESMREWLAGHGYTTKLPVVRAFLDRWSLRIQEEEILLDSPARFRFFLFLLRQNHAYRPLQTWRLTALNYLFAPSALLLGYDSVARFYERRGAAMKVVERLFGSGTSRGGPPTASL